VHDLTIRKDNTGTLGVPLAAKEEKPAVVQQEFSWSPHEFDTETGDIGEQGNKIRL
jgi:hypothetical protein